MTESELLVDRLGALAVIRLNRPRAINALSLTMLEGLETWLAHLAADDSVRAVLLRGEGEKGFCAGGDVRAVRQAVLAGEPGEVRRYFETEYRVDQAVGEFAKPVIAIQHGIVMGGGIGLSGHARHRVAVAGARFAMPEPAIGFFGDVGVNFLLSKVPEHRALAFLMSGDSVGPGDAMALNLTDAVVPESRLEGLTLALIEAASAGDPEGAIGSAIAAHEALPGGAPFCTGTDRLAEAFAGAGPAEALGRLDAAAAAGDGFAGELAASLRRGSPAALAANWAAHKAARGLSSLAEVLAVDLAMAVHMAGRPDFAEGVRAVLVDKDRAPGWAETEPDDARLAEFEAVAAGAAAH